MIGEQEKEKVVISLGRYEKLKEQASKGSDKGDKAKEILEGTKKAASELGQFLNFLAEKVENIEELVNTFNENSEHSAIIYSDDRERYYIELFIEQENNNG